MALLLVRHGKAGSRKAWVGDDRRRPLSAAGRRQADALAPLLAPFDPGRVLSSPFLRCIQTVEPLASAISRDVEAVDALAENHLAAAIELAASLLGTTTVLCTHGDVVPAVLTWAIDEGAALEHPLDWPKGSVWLLEGARTVERVSYLGTPFARS